MLSTSLAMIASQNKGCGFSLKLVYKINYRETRYRVRSQTDFKPIVGLFCDGGGELPPLNSLKKTVEMVSNEVWESDCKVCREDNPNDR